MPQNWKTYNFGELFLSGSGLSKPRNEFGFGNSFVTFKDVFYNYFLPTELSELANTNEKEIKSCSVKKGDIFLTRTSETLHELGMSSVALKDYPNATFNGFCKRLRKKEDCDVEIDPVFMGYYLRSNLFRNEVSKHATMTTRASLNNDAIYSLEITLPDIQTQKAIGLILKPLDDKIELNLQMNKTLEEMAMTLYKHWFVNFGPFQNGKFVESELGMIPEGWEVKRLDNILTVKRGGSPRPIREFLSEDGYHWLKISDATASISPFLYTTKEYIKEEGLRKTVLMKPGSIVLSNSATPGLPRFLEFETCIHDGWLHFPEIKRLNKYILYLLFLDIKEHLIQQGNGSVFTNLKTDILKSQLIKLPPIEIEEKFSNKIVPWFEKIKSNTEENLTLTKTRDTLLPKLISGEVRVKQAEKIIMKTTKPIPQYKV